MCASASSQNANAVKGKLQEQLKMADQILTLAELARKMETEQEKVRTDRWRTEREPPIGLLASGKH